MLKGILVIVIFFILALAAVFNFPADTDFQAENEKKEALETIEVYKTKYMFQDAGEMYYSLIKKYPDDEKLSEDYFDFCIEHGFNKQAAEHYENLLSKTHDKKIAEELLGLYCTMDSTKRYSLITVYRELLQDTETYKKIRKDQLSQLRSKKSRISELEDWAGGRYAVFKNDDGLVGIVGTDGRETVSPLYDDITSYSYEDELIAINDNDQLSYCDSTGKRVLVPYNSNDGTLIYLEYAGPFENGISNIKRDGQWGYANAELKYAQLQYEKTTPFSCGISAAKTSEGWILLNSSMTKINDIRIDDIYTDSYGYCCFNDIIYIKEKTGYRMYHTKKNENGTVQSVEPVTDKYFDDVKPFTEYGAVKQGNKWGFIDSSGNWFIEPSAQYEDASSFRCGYATVKHDGKWGFICVDDPVLTECIYDDATSFSEMGCVGIKMDDYWKIMQLPEYYYK